MSLAERRRQRMKLRIHIDGGSRGNPGPAGAGVVLEKESGRPLLEAGYYLGRMTNNMAEYNALIRGIDAAIRAGASELSILSDSELMVRQINGAYRVRSPALKGLHATALGKLRRIRQWRLQHVRREANQRADELANAAMDQFSDVVVNDIGAIAGERSGPAEDPAAAATVIARCTRAADPAVCPAACQCGGEFVFQAVVPAGVCVGIAAELIRATSAVATRGGSVEVSCPRSGCGARFQVTAP